MDVELVVLRLLHIVPGAIWVGAAVFAALIMEPSFRALAPTTQEPAIRVISPRTVQMMSIAAGITILIGFALITRTPGRGFDQLFTNGWGWSIGLGTVAAILAAAVGGRLSATGKRLVAAGEAAEAGSTSGAQVAAQQARLRQLGWLNAALVIIAVALMAVARYV